MILGIDIGSVSSKAVLLDDGLALLGAWEERNAGRPADAYRRLIRSAFGRSRDLRLKVGLTGAGRDLIAIPPEFFVSNEVIALALGAARWGPRARSVIEVGGQTSRWVLLDPATAEGDGPAINDFALNEVCAAGSGAFLEQQAARLKVSIEEFAALAASARRGAAIAGRCSVFAKSDMVHLQQKGTPVEEIAYGLCLALARNFVASVLRGRECLPPILMAGGAVRNIGLANAFREVLGFGPDEWVHLDGPQWLGAMGAAAGAAQTARETRFGSAEEFDGLLRLQAPARPRQVRPLGTLAAGSPEEPSPAPGEFVRAYLGVDIGSVSTNLVLMNEKGEVKAGVYLPTRGRPIEALQEGYRLLRAKCPAGFETLGVGTTGSGRHLAGKLLRADTVHNEITCQLRSAARYVPDVDTVFEIGGQDSKYISARDGRILDFAMNKICAAGTGSFLEEQAGLLGLRIEDEFARVAALSPAPCDLSSRCTVFMESELSDALGRGVPGPDIAGGLAFAIVRNYLEKVVGDRPVGRAVVFQGGVASNPAVVRAFELELDRPVRVHPHNRISGAIGAALMVAEALRRRARTSPGAAELARRLDRRFDVRSFTCAHCSNRCQVNRIAVEDETVYFGDTCERYTSQAGLRAAAGVSPEQAGKSSGRRTPEFDLFRERENLLSSFIRNPERPEFRAGLVRASFLCESLPFWASFLNRLGGEVTLSPESSMDLLAAGSARLPAETCLPIKVALGHVHWFGNRPVDWVFFPSIIDAHQEPGESVQLCPYTEHFPFMARAAAEARILAPSVLFNAGEEAFLRSMKEVQTALGKTKDDILAARGAAFEARAEFHAALEVRGREVMAALRGDGRPVWAVLGRPYVLHDAFMNLGLGRHLEKLGVAAVPMDFLSFSLDSIHDWPGAPPWRYNQLAIQAARWAAETEGVYPLILTSFGCGLDAFNLTHLQRIIGDRPHLILEFDEHRGEAGLITRLEAFADEVGESRAGGPGPARRPPRPPGPGLARRPPRPPGKVATPEGFEAYKGRKFVFPYFADHVHAYAGAFRGVGFESEILPPPDAGTIALGERYTSGKECHAYAIIAGDFVTFGRSKRAGGEVFVFPGTKYLCVLHQYDTGLNYLAEDLGLPGLEALAPDTDFLFQTLGLRGLTLLWQGVVATDLLIRASCARRPYELRRGESDAAHRENLRDIEAGLAAGDIGPALKRAAERLADVRIRKERRPLVGIAGDIYTRQNAVANHDLLLKLEELGCEVRPAPFLVDEVDFGLRKGLEDKFLSRRYPEVAVSGLLYLRKELHKWKVRQRLESAGVDSDPSFKEIVRFTAPYVGLDNNQIVLLNIARMVDYARKGADGVINAICFNCMLGTVSAAIAARVRKDCGDIPIPTFIFTGAELATGRTKLEAFVYQVKQSAARKRRTKQQNR